MKTIKIETVANIPLISIEFAAKQISDDVCRDLMEQLPTLDQIENRNLTIENSIEVENKLLNDHQKVTKELEPLLLEIIPTEIVYGAYRNIALLSNFNLGDFGGKAINEFDYVRDETLRQHVSQAHY
ncbi:hypothetical protein GLOIN_2v1656851 [Rhizophagus irregularis DAOM 181602=DAOM 197198]|nr:hypothetical protein GLOIN_2v1656851 [Rhizophagus irregularis DAOM 181602=DAOM 197198]